jgi:hypothetical protein
MLHIFNVRNKKIVTVPAESERPFQSPTFQKLAQFANQSRLSHLRSTVTVGRSLELRPRKGRRGEGE